MNVSVIISIISYISMQGFFHKFEIETLSLPNAEIEILIDIMSSSSLDR